MNFSIERYTELAGKLDLDGYDVEAFKDQPLDAETLRCLRYMHDVEFHTVCYLRDLLVTRAHNDAEITTFLTFWGFEEYWHGEAIAAILHAHGEEAGAARVNKHRIAIGVKDRLRPIGTMLASALSKDFTATYLTWGAVNEWTTQAGYARVAAKANHPMLSELLKRIMKQEGRHIDFYASQAAVRLEASRLAQRFTRYALEHMWHPVGYSVMPKDEVRFLISYLFNNEDGRNTADRIDRRIEKLPGLGGLRLINDSIDQYGTLATAG